MDTSKLKKRSEVKQTESPIETKLAVWFYKYGLFPELQYEIGRYRADMAFLDRKIVIECDGREFHSTPEQVKYDNERDEYMRGLGWIVERFSGTQIHREPWNIVKKIMDYYYPPPRKYTYWENLKKQNILSRQAAGLLPVEELGADPSEWQKWSNKLSTG